MKIGISTFGGDGGKSGISQYIIKLLQQFAVMDRDQLMEVIVYGDEESIFVPPAGGLKPLCYDGSWRRPIVNIAWHQVLLPRLCSRRDYDVLFLPAGNRRLPLSVPCPTVGTVHDFSSIHVEGKYDPGRVFYIKQVLPFLIRRLSHVITVSESSRKDIIEFAAVPEDRITMIPNAVDHGVYFPRDRGECGDRVAQRYGIRLPYILYLSRIEHPGKNHVRLIEAFELLKAREDIPHQLVLAGSDWTRAEAVHEAAAESRFSRDILFTGFVAGADIPLLYCGAELFVFPSLYEGFGMPILEAMACGTPMACSNLSSMPEVAGDAGVLFDPYQEEDIARAMGSLLTDRELRDTLVQRGIERSSQFTWAATAQKTVQVLEQTSLTG
jgi:glycosyltransferase involved in cell wall biosynthesis